MRDIIDVQFALNKKMSFLKQFKTAGKCMVWRGLICKQAQGTD